MVPGAPPASLGRQPGRLQGHDNAGVGPGLAFAQAIEAKLDRVRIALVPCAVGGTPISRWAAGQRLYDDCVRKAKLALAQGPCGKTHIRAALWLQGEAESRSKS
ncbi:MAG: sialate O-acetylesterase [Bryobacterales bacterium]